MKLNTMNRLLPVVILALVSSCMMGQVTGDGNVILREREADDFTGIVVTSGINLVICQGDRIRVGIKADENLQEYIVSEVRDHVLYIYIPENIDIRQSNALDALVMMKDIRHLKLSGGGNLRTWSKINTEDLTIEFSGGGSLELDVNYVKYDPDSFPALAYNIKGMTAFLSGG